MTESANRFLDRNELRSLRIFVGAIFALMTWYLSLETLDSILLLASGAGVMLILLEDYIVGASIALLALTGMSLL